jgi:polysaccharide biosynthesis transport protein
MLRFVSVKRPRVVGVTSTAPGEGKSIIVANLANMLAREGTRVLVIDADLHRPTQHSVFGIAAIPGLTDILIGDIEAEAAIQHHETGVFVIPSGTMTPNPAELLANPAFVKLISEMRDKFEMVLIDTAPVLAVADPAIVGSSTDGMLVVATVNKTNGFALARGVDQLRQAASPLLGLILNRVPQTTGSGRYGGGNYYYSYQSMGYGANGAHETSTPVRNRLKALFKS